MKKIWLVILLLTTIPLFSQEDNTNHFKILKKVPATPVKNQALSSTCWSFATVSFLESELLRMAKGEFDLSEMFVARNIYKEKALMHIRLQGNNFLTPGGQPHDVLHVLDKYGIVPEPVYNGKPYLGIFHDHSKLDTIAKYYIKKIANQDHIKENWMFTLDTLLDKYLGHLPEKFRYGNKESTAKDFAIETLGLKKNDYLEITSYLHHPFYKPFILESRFNWSMDSYYNVPLEDFCMIIDSAIYRGFSIVFNGDVSEPGFQFEKGTVELKDEKTNISQQMRQNAFESHATTVDHDMHIIGIASDKAGNKYYLTKNSWGKENPFAGYMYLSDKYIRLKCVSILVNKKAIPSTLLKKLDVTR